MKKQDRIPNPQNVENAVKLLDRNTTEVLRTLWEAPIGNAPRVLQQRVPASSRMALIDLKVVTDDYHLTTFGCYVIDHIASHSDCQ